MQEPASAASASSPALREALLDFSQSPGKYQVALRQPKQLFAALREVLQCAVARDGEAGGGNQEALPLQEAARFFVRTALLFPGADHYALLGVERSADNAELKDRYRLLMRLLHPDFSSPGGDSWPADSAVRVNLAYDTLSSAVQRRLYDETFAHPHVSAAAVGTTELKCNRPTVARRHEGDVRQSSFKVLAVVCAFAGAGLLTLIIFATGSSESVQLVQRTRAPTESAAVALLEQDSRPVPSPVTKLQEAFAQLRPAPADAPARQADPPAARSAPVTHAKRIEAPIRPSPEPGPRPVAPAPQAERGNVPVASALVQPAEPKMEILLAAAPAAAPTPPQTPPAVVSMPSVQAAPVFRPVPRSGPTLVEAQPLLSQLLLVMESGRGERILNLLDAEARSKPLAQALSRQYDSIVDGARPVRVSNVEFKAEPGDGRLLVVGHFRLSAGEQTIGSLGKKMVLRAEFASREGGVVITGLSGGPVN